MTTTSQVAALLCACLAAPRAARAQDQVVELNAFLDAWHHAAAVAAESSYFAALDSDAVYLGTDPGERWSKQAFREWAKPYFARGKAWAFTPFGRHISVASDGQVAWFDEKLRWFDTSLNAWLGTLRGSGVIRRTSAGWRIVQYNLAMELPNDRLGDIVHLLRVSSAVPPADAKAILGTVRGPLDPLTRVTVVAGDDSSAHATTSTGAQYWTARGPATVHDSIPEATVLGDGTVAFVWAPFIRYDGTKRTGCGLDQFELVRSMGSWRIAALTVHERTSCGGDSN